MNHPLDAFSHSDELSEENFDIFCQKLGAEHPYNIEQIDVLHYYDGPIIFIGKVSGDDRPRLDVQIDENSIGDENTRIFHSVRHQLVFDSEETLRATLCEYGTPTRESYRLADFIVRYETLMTRIGHPFPAHHIKTSIMNMAAIPAIELPDQRAAVGINIEKMEK